MPIKEKTVELNLTTEMSNLLSVYFRCRASVWAPTPHEEAQLGFDARIDAAGFALLIQYKHARLHRRAGEWRFDLNETVGQDQHKRLCDRANAGTPTRYALPLFDDYQVIRDNVRTGNLWGLPLVYWIDPRQIPFPNNGVGRHTLGVGVNPPHSLAIYSDPLRFKAEKIGVFPILREIAEKLRATEPDRAAVVAAFLHPTETAMGESLRNRPTMTAGMMMVGEPGSWAST
ncbi:MAG TPA: hypothetical protein VFB13_17505 [Reyranella sp.]|jgi:hypothetical protein|nr:hypothetical protein [Reyranella sp.]